MKVSLSIVLGLFCMLISNHGYAGISNQAKIASANHPSAEAINPNAGGLIQPKWYCSSYCVTQTENAFIFQKDSNGSQLFVRQGDSPEGTFGELQSSCAAVSGAELIQGSFIASFEGSAISGVASIDSSIANSCIRLRP